jgi:hypothetical protein
MHRDFFQGQTDRDLFYWPEHLEKLGCPSKKKKKKLEVQLGFAHKAEFTFEEFSAISKA